MAMGRKREVCVDGKKYSDTELLGIVVDLGRGKSADELRGLHRLDADTARLLVEQWEASGATLRSVCEQLAQVQRALEGSEGRYRRITQAVTDYVFTVRVENGVVVDTVHGLGCAAVTGYTTEDFAANPMLWVNMVDERDRQSVVDHAQKLLSGKPVDAIEHRIVRKDGVRRWVRNTPVQHFDANGRLTSYDGLIRDITEQKRAEEALRASEARFRAIFERAGLGITLVNVQGELIDCNLVFERMLDYSHEEIMALGLVNVTQPEDVANDWREFKDLITGKREHYQTEKRFVRKDGGILWGRVTVSLIRDVDGAPQYGIGLVEDITERKRSEEERR